MILADKIVKLRKEKGWSQEELAEKMDVSRQAVSKWESGQAYPDIEKILSLAKLFEVSTDYLLKDELGDTERADKENADDVRRVSLKEANTYIELRKKASWRIALATLLCILSPIPLLILGSISSIYPQHMSETVAAAIGLSALFVFVVAAIPFYI